MKYTEILIAIILFGGIMFSIFHITAEFSKHYNPRDESIYRDLSSTYGDEYADVSLEDNGTLREISNKLDDAEFSTVSAAVGAIDSVLQAGKLIKGTVSTGAKLTDQIAEDTSTYIHPIVFTIIKSILVVIIVILLLTIFLKIKAET